MQPVIHRREFVVAARFMYNWMFGNYKYICITGCLCKGTQFLNLNYCSIVFFKNKCVKVNNMFSNNFILILQFLIFDFVNKNLECYKKTLSIWITKEKY